MSEHIQSWVREVAHLAPDAVVRVRDESHCPDPSCPLRRTVIIWADSAGQHQRISIVKPAAYVRRAEVERAWRLFSLQR